jgi:hypothetical protein
MATDSFSEKRIQEQPLDLDPKRTAVIAVDMVKVGGTRLLWCLPRPRATAPAEDGRYQWQGQGAQTEGAITRLC